MNECKIKVKSRVCKMLLLITIISYQYVFSMMGTNC